MVLVNVFMDRFEILDLRFETNYADEQSENQRNRRNQKNQRS